MKIGAAVAPVLEDIANRVAEIGTQVVDWVDNNRPLVPQIAAVGVAITAVGGSVAMLGGGLMGVGTAIGVVKSIASIVLPFFTVGFAVAAAKVGLVVGAIGAVYAGFGYLLNRAGLLAPAFDYLKESFGRVYSGFKEMFGGIVTALGSGRFKAAAGIAWSGVKVVTLRAAQQVLKGIEGLWDNAGSITHRFVMSTGTLIVNAFKALPKLAWALKGGKSLAEVLASTIEGVFDKKIEFASSLNPAIAKAEAEMRGRIAAIEYYKEAIDKQKSEKRQDGIGEVGSGVSQWLPNLQSPNAPPVLPSVVSGAAPQYSALRIPQQRFRPEQLSGPPLDDQYEQIRQLPSPAEISQSITTAPAPVRQSQNTDFAELTDLARQQLSAQRRLVAMGGLE